MRLRLALPLSAMLVGLIVFAGCGGDDDSSSDTALSKSEFLAQGNAVCEKGEKEIDAAAEDVFTQGQAPSQAAQEKFVTETVVPSIQDQIDGLRALSPPAGDEAEVKAITDAAQSALDEAKSDPGVLTEQGGQGDPFAEANKLAKDYGLDKCAG